MPVRRPPRGVPEIEFASGDWYDVWLPNLSPSADLVKRALAAETDREWAAFAKAYRGEIAEPEPNRPYTVPRSEPDPMPLVPVRLSAVGRLLFRGR